MVKLLTGGFTDTSIIKKEQHVKVQYGSLYI